MRIQTEIDKMSGARPENQAKLVQGFCTKALQLARKMKPERLKRFRRLLQIELEKLGRAARAGWAMALDRLNVRLKDIQHQFA